MSVLLCGNSEEQICEKQEEKRLCSPPYFNVQIAFSSPEPTGSPGELIV